VRRRRKEEGSAALRDLKRENRETRNKREGERDGKEINAHRRESVHGSELRHSRCVREKMRRGDGGGLARHRRAHLHEKIG
jgi:hypothetical protein